MNNAKQNIRSRLQEIIFEADTKAGKLFDVLLLWAIGISVVVVALESVPSLNALYGNVFHVVEWVFTGLLIYFQFYLLF